MAKVGNAKNTAAVPSPTGEGDGLESATPRPEDLGPKEGIHLTRPRTTVVDEYPERPYADAVTVDHLELLKAHGQEPV